MQTLTEILNQITPLPHTRKDQGVFAPQLRFNQAYHLHAANALPELVKCIKAHSAAVLAFDVAKAEWKSNPTEDNKAILRRMSLKQSHAHDALQSAIARAERVE